VKKRKDRFLYYVIKSAVKLFYPNMQIVGSENIPERDAIIIANHSQMNGPICAELFMPDNSRIWCAGQMMHLKEVPAYAFEDFWSAKPALLKPFYKLLSYIIAPLAVCVFNNARTIAVYHDQRGLSTFKNTISELKNGSTIVIFPEGKKLNNNVVNEFNEHFADVAKLYAKSSGKELLFVPMYIAPDLKQIHVMKGVRFDSQNDIDVERKRICREMTDAITEKARSLPRHKVVPYDNISKKKYLTNKDINEVPR